MKAVLSIALLSTLSLTASAAQIHKARAYSSVPSYTVKTVTSDGNTQYTPSSNGYVNLSFYPTAGGVFLTHAELDNEYPAESATCVARDNRGNQVRAFGGPQFGNVDAVDFVPADGKQVFSLSCSPVV